ncbi:MAG TPA: family 1 glycosylhydrolase [Pyrinomonadaceae bacterium]|jgi:beta-glucosidase/6-phospho-beta-glucosidase/beta-galactosidase
MLKFMFATGIENSYPTIALADGTKKRVDQMEKAQHYDRWRDDFKLVKQLGIEYLRYGPPYYRVHLGTDHYDWAFADETFKALQDAGIKPIADLCHFGVPDWMGDFQNPEFPAKFADYARAFAKRFPWVEFYTPVNQILSTAINSALDGLWNECLSHDQGFATALKHLCQASVMSMLAILEVQPKAIFIPSETARYFHPYDPSCETEAGFLNDRRFLSLDLIYGQPLNTVMYDYLLSNGWTRDEYLWFMGHRLKEHGVLGLDYYYTNEQLIHPDGNSTFILQPLGYYVLAKQFYARYRLPVMNTETNMDIDLGVDWLRKVWASMLHLKSDGIPTVGFTWHSLIDQVDWDVRLAEDNDQVNRLGLCSMEREINHVGEEFRRIINQWRDV